MGYADPARVLTNKSAFYFIKVLSNALNSLWADRLFARLVQLSSDQRIVRTGNLNKKSVGN